MLAWTGAGAVQKPQTLQIRLQRTYPGRVRAGAPVPTRAMTTEEVLENIRFFTRSTPRSLPVKNLVLSGVGAGSRPDLKQLVEAGRGLGVEGVVLHLGVEDLESLVPAQLPPLQRLVVPLASGDAAASLSQGAAVIQQAQDLKIPLSASVTLSSASLPALPMIGRILEATRVSVAFTFPFPVDGGQAATVPTAGQTVAALKNLVPELLKAGLSVDIKGLPPCYLGELGGLVRKTGNRWYVDADHQLEGALLFFPDVVAFFKGEDCRFCRCDTKCDGFFATYLRRPGFPPLSPLS